VLYAAARAIVRSAGEARARELADSMYAELYGLNRAGGEGRPLLDYFHGRSKLATWLHAVLAQRHVDSLRAGKHTESLDDDEPLAPHRPVALPPSRTPTATGSCPACGKPLPAPWLLRRPPIACCFAVLRPEMKLAQIARLQGVHEPRFRANSIASAVSCAKPFNMRSLQGTPPKMASRAAGLSAAEVELCFARARGLVVRFEPPLSGDDRQRHGA
jgi:hypothetical protein